MALLGPYWVGRGNSTFPPKSWYVYIQKDTGHVVRDTHYTHTLMKEHPFYTVYCTLLQNIFHIWQDAKLISSSFQLRLTLADFFIHHWKGSFKRQLLVEIGHNKKPGRLTCMMSTLPIFPSCNGMHTQSCLTLCDPSDCSTPDSSIHRIFQARILEWVVISYSKGSSQPSNQSCISSTSCTGRWILYHWSHLGRSFPVIGLP